MTSIPRPRRTAATAAAQRAERESARSHALWLALDAIDQGRYPRVLDALEGRAGRDEGGPYAPIVRGRWPYWHPPLPACTWDVWDAAGGYGWSRPFAGPVVTLDRSGAFVAATSSVEVAHGALEHTGETDDVSRPGYYLVVRHPWYHGADVPDPLGGVHRSKTQVWVPQPIAKLLRDLAEEGRWADIAVLDSWTAQPCRLWEWSSKFVNDGLRDYSIDKYGRGSEEYDRVKQAFSLSLALLAGRWDDERGRRVWGCRAARPDWRHAILAQAAVSAWRWVDDMRRMCPPELGPVAMRHVDEIVLPEDALGIVTSTDRPGGGRPLRIDDRGVALGTFKIKERWVRDGEE